jgi:hypothetical protein
LISCHGYGEKLDIDIYFSLPVATNVSGGLKSVKMCSVSTSNSIRYTLASNVQMDLMGRESLFVERQCPKGLVQSCDSENFAQMSFSWEEEVCA